MDAAAVVIEALEHAPRVVVPLVRELPTSILKRRPAQGKWSAHEHACHLAVVHCLFFDRLDVMLATPAPIITPYDPGTNDPDDRLLVMDLEAALQQYSEERVTLVTRLRRLTSSDWTRTAEHGEYSHYS